MAQNSEQADAAYAEALKRIEEWGKQRESDLYLSELGLTTLPREDFHLNDLPASPAHWVSFCATHPVGGVLQESHRLMPPQVTIAAMVAIAEVGFMVLVLTRASPAT